jgi:phosphoribosylformylglycinamidine synthase
MIYFFADDHNTVFALQIERTLTASDTSKLTWLFGGAQLQSQTTIADFFVGPRAAMITPWSTNAVEITQNMDIQGIVRIEEFKRVGRDFTDFDPMLSQKYGELNQEIYTISIQPESII